MPSPEEFTRFLPEAPRQIREVNPEFPRHFPKGGEIHAESMAFRLGFLFEGKRAEELPVDAAEDENVRAFHELASDAQDFTAKPKAATVSGQNGEDSDFDPLPLAFARILRLLLFGQDVINRVEHRLGVEIE